MPRKKGSPGKITSDLTGCVYGKLTVISRAEQGPGHKARWNCLCECGQSCVIYGYNLQNGHTKSCGCLHKNNDTSKIRAGMSNNYSAHGQSDSNLYKVWSEMKRRCNNPHDTRYDSYGGRGITYCDEWEQFIPFYEWSMANEYAEGLTIDRIDVDGNYCPENCRWVTIDVQANNKKNNVLLTYEGCTLNAKQWAK